MSLLSIPARIAPGLIKSAESLVLASSNPLLRAVGQSIVQAERFPNHDGYAWGVMAQDVALSWGSKLFTLKSPTDFFEVTCNEAMENSVLYFGIPLMGNVILRKGLSLIAGLQADEIRQPLHQIVQMAKPMQAKVLASRAALIIGAVGAMSLGAEYAMPFIKNLLTLKLFKKSSYTNILNLSPDQANSKKQAEAVEKKAWHRIRIAGLMGLASLATAASLALIARSGKADLLLKPLLNFVKFADFNVNLQSNKLSMSQVQMGAFMAAAFVSYCDAARETIERKEIAGRLGVVLPALLFGDQILTTLFNIPKNLPAQLVHVDPVTMKRTLKGLFETSATLLKTMAPEKALEEIQPLLMAHLKQIALPKVLSVVFAGILMNVVARAFSQYNFNQQEKAKQAALSVPSSDGTSNDSGKSTPSMPLQSYAPMPVMPSAQGFFQNGSAGYMPVFQPAFFQGSTAWAVRNPNPPIYWA
jgi:hypothetical protein